MKRNLHHVRQSPYISLYSHWPKKDKQIYIIVNIYSLTGCHNWINWGERWIYRCAVRLFCMMLTMCIYQPWSISISMYTYRDMARIWSQNPDSVSAFQYIRQRWWWCVAIATRGVLITSDTISNNIPNPPFEPIGICHFKQDRDHLRRLLPQTQFPL